MRVVTTTPPNKVNRSGLTSDEDIAAADAADLLLRLFAGTSDYADAAIHRAINHHLCEHANVCTHCFTVGARCQCWNDE